MSDLTDALKLFLKLVFAACELGERALENIPDSQSHKKLRAQIGILDAVINKFLDGEVKKAIRAVDLLKFFDVVKEVYELLLRFNKKTYSKLTGWSPKLEAEYRLLRKVDNLELQKGLTKMEQRQRMDFWIMMKDEERLELFRKGKRSWLIKIEFWGSKLDELVSWTIPGIFRQSTIADIQHHVGDDRLSTTNVKSQLLIIQSTTSSLPDSFDIDVSQINFDIPPPYRDTDSYRNQSLHQLGRVTHRQWANFKDTNGQVNLAIVEFRPRPDSWSNYEVADAENSVRLLVSTLQIAAQRPETFHVLDCYGCFYTHESFGIVYKLPAQYSEFGHQCETLRNILFHEQYKKVFGSDQSHRLKLATALSWTIFELHSVGWVHKSLNPDNILVFKKEKDRGNVEFDWSSPYVVGFDLARPNTGYSGKLNLNEQWSTRIYTHPDRLREDKFIRYEKFHDLYSLGVVLLELGMGECLMDSLSAPWLREPPDGLMQSFIQKAQELKPILGEVYVDVILVCLNARELNVLEDYLQTCEFRDRVCLRLNQSLAPICDIEFNNSDEPTPRTEESVLASIEVGPSTAHSTIDTHLSDAHQDGSEGISVTVSGTEDNLPFSDYAEYMDPVVSACFSIDFPKKVGEIINENHSSLFQYISPLHCNCYFVGGYNVVPDGYRLQYPEQSYCFQGNLGSAGSDYSQETKKCYGSTVTEL